MLKHWNYGFHFFSQCELLSLSFYETQYRRRCSQTHTLIPMNTRTQPTPMSTSERLSRQIIEINEITIGASLSRGTSPTTEKIAPIKSWNKPKKIIWALVPSRGLEPWWAGSTTRNLTSVLSSRTSLWNMLETFELKNPTFFLQNVNFSLKVFLRKGYRSFDSKCIRRRKIKTSTS